MATYGTLVGKAGNPSGGVEDESLNSRPFVSVTPVNNVNIRLYVDRDGPRGSP